MIIFTTKSGSTYEVDMIKKLFRKAGEEWIRFDRLGWEPIKVGQAVMFIQGERYTRTTRVLTVKAV